MGMEQHPFIFSDQRKYRIYRHLAFWVSWWIFQGFLYSFVTLDRPEIYWDRLPNSFAEALAFMTLHIFLSYSLMYFVIPRYLLKQRYWLTAIWVIVLFLLTALMSSVLSVTIIPMIRHFFLGTDYTPPRHIQNIFLSLMAGLRGGITIGGMAAAIKLMKYWYVKEQRNLQLQKENAESQLQLLKAQVHPHFLFNTLNNIYAKTQGSAPVASRLVMELSDILRFILYECGQPLVPLSKELKMIRDYIALESVRYDDQFDLHIDLPDDTGELPIAPLLLLPLIENCFKHGTSNMLEHPWMSLQVSVDGGNLHVKLMNGKPSAPARNENTNGIGINNVRRRLELLYPGKHLLSITNDPDVFIVNLSIQLQGNTPLSRKKYLSTIATDHE